MLQCGRHACTIDESNSVDTLVYETPRQQKGTQVIPGRAEREGRKARCPPRHRLNALRCSLHITPPSQCLVEYAQVVSFRWPLCQLPSYTWYSENFCFFVWTALSEVVFITGHLPAVCCSWPPWFWAIRLVESLACWFNATATGTFRTS